MLHRTLLAAVAALALAGPARGDVRQVAAVVDGDTLDLLTAGGGFIRTVRVRAMGYDTPEKASKCEAEKRHAYEAAARLRTLTINGVDVTHAFEFDQYGRALTTLRLGRDTGAYKAGETIGDILTKEGYARLYNGGARRPWCDAAGNLTP